MENHSDTIKNQDDLRAEAAKKLLKKIGVAVVKALMAPVNATIQMITYPFRFLVDSVKQVVDLSRGPNSVGSEVFGFVANLVFDI